MSASTGIPLLGLSGLFSLSGLWWNETNQMNQINQINKTNQPCFLEPVMSEWNVPDLIDHTVLRPDATKLDVLRLCQEAKEFRFSVIFVPPCYVDEAVAACVRSSLRRPAEPGRRT